MESSPPTATTSTLMGHSTPMHGDQTSQHDHGRVFRDLCDFFKNTKYQKESYYSQFTKSFIINGC